VEGADPARPGQLSIVRGQAACAATTGRVRSISLNPANPPACPEAVAAILDADWVVLGPGSWFTSVLPHLLVPELADALISTRARRLVALNLAPQPGETRDSTLPIFEVLADHAPELTVDGAGDVARLYGATAQLEKAAACSAAGWSWRIWRCGMVAAPRSAAAGGGVRGDSRGGADGHDRSGRTN
jgi:hypothetical protein